MKKSREKGPKETVYVWTGGEIQRLQKSPRRAAASTVVEPPAAPAGSIEHRRYPRLDLKLPILYKVLGKNSSRIPSNVRPFLLTETTNVSTLGLCLNLEEQFPQGTVLALSIHVLDKREKFSAVGRVMWSQAAGLPGHFLTGVQFVIVEGDNVRKESQTRMQDLIHRLEKEGGPPPE